ncbi:Transposon Tf2-1 polyprotein [Cladobotryum mycophilum]|uniref:Transposon Tf2-1 polyprotein n=1 Tax=Cladobotryum mycophilum TaxID=491253 RepID=A0ABR0S511_9HYPO
MPLQGSNPETLIQSELGEMPLRDEMTRAREQPDEVLLKGQEPQVEGSTGEGLPNPERLADWATAIAERAQLMPQEDVKTAMSQEVVYETKVSQPLLDLVAKAQAKDPETQKRVEAEAQALPKRKQGKWDVDPEGLLRYKNLIFIPDDEVLRRELLQLYHNDPLAGHFGKDRTLELLQRKFYWHRMDQEIREYIQSYNTCQGTVAQRHKPYGKLKSLLIPSRPF